MIDLDLDLEFPFSQRMSSSMLYISTVSRHTHSFFSRSPIRRAGKQLFHFNPLSSGCHHNMEGPNALKRTVHVDDIPESASKRLKPTGSTPAESPAPAPPVDSDAPHEIRGEPDLVDVPDGGAKIEHGAERTKRARGNNTPGKTSKRKKKDEKKPTHWGRRGTRNDEVAEGNNTQGSDQPDAFRLPKRRCALLIGFCGSGYSGMQM